MAYNGPALNSLLSWAEAEKEKALGEGQLDIAIWVQLPNRLAVFDSAGEPECGTVMCLAGRAATADGWRPAGLEALEYLDESTPVRITKVVRDGQVRSVPEAARESLGLTELEADLLFAQNFSSKDWAVDVCLDFLEELVYRAEREYDNLSDDAVRAWYLDQMVDKYGIPGL